MYNSVLVLLNVINFHKLNVSGLKVKITCRRTKTNKKSFDIPSSKTAGGNYKQSGMKVSSYRDIIFPNFSKPKYGQSNGVNG